MGFGCFAEEQERGGEDEQEAEDEKEDDEGVFGRSSAAQEGVSQPRCEACDDDGRGDEEPDEDSSVNPGGEHSAGLLDVEYFVGTEPSEGVMYVWHHFSMALWA